MGALSGRVTFGLNLQQNSAIELSPHGKMALAFHTPTPNVHWLWATRGGSHQLLGFFSIWRAAPVIVVQSSEGSQRYRLL